MSWKCRWELRACFERRNFNNAVRGETEIRDKGEYEKEKRGKRNKRTQQELGAYGES